jgi:cellulose biosynthesis protein BcsQ
MRSNSLVVLNQCPPARNGVESTVVQTARETLSRAGASTAQALLRSRAAYQHAFAQQQGVTEWGPDSDAAADVLKLLAEVSDALLLPAAHDSLGARPIRAAA